MRIDLSNSTAAELASELSSQQVSAQNTAKADQVAGEDHATLTSDSTSVGSLATTALKSPEVRQDKVDNLRLVVDSGQYEINPGKIAASILDEHA